MTGNDVINEALLLLKRITPGQTASTDEIATCQKELGALIDEWNGLGIAVYSTAPITFSLTGASAYTIGVGGTINVPRPVRVEAWNVRTASGQANGGRPLTGEEFATVAVDRGATGSRCKALNYDAAYPLASVHLYPIPAGGGTLELWVWSQLAAISDFTLALTLPPAYLQSLIYNLAVALAGKFATRAPIDPNVVSVANETRQTLASMNSVQHATPAPPQGGNSQ